MTATQALEALTKGINDLRDEIGPLREFRKTYAEDDEKRKASEARIDELETSLKAFLDKQAELEKGFFAHGAKQYDEKTGKGFNFARAVNAHVRKDWSNAKEEYDILDQCGHFSHQVKMQGMQIDSTGGFAVPENLVPGLIELLQTNTVFNAANIGCMEMPAVPGTMKFNRIATAFAPAAQAQEGDTLTDTTMEIKQLNFEPKTCGATVDCSNLMLANNAAGANMWIQAQIARDMSIEKDRWVLRGSGASGESLGILNDPDIGTSSVTDPAIEFDEVEAIRLVVANANGIMGNKMAWAGAPTMLSKVRFAPSGVGNVDMVRMSHTEPANASLIGYPVFESNNFSASTGADALIFGDWSRLLIANFSGLMIAGSEHAKFTSDETVFRALQYVDSGALQPGAFCKSA